MTLRMQTMVPVITTVKAVVTVDEGVNMSKIVYALFTGKVPSSMTIEDQRVDKMAVDDSRYPLNDFETQIQAFVEDKSHDAELLGWEITDSK